LVHQAFQDGTFEYCKSICRTSSKSVVARNKYRNQDDKFCYGPEPPPIENLPHEELTEHPPPPMDENNDNYVGHEEDDHDHYPFLNGVAARDQDSASMSLIASSSLPFLLGLSLVITR
jgi:hypothetical protein